MAASDIVGGARVRRCWREEERGGTQEEGQGGRERMNMWRRLGKPWRRPLHVEATYEGGFEGGFEGPFNQWLKATSNTN